MRFVAFLLPATTLKGRQYNLSVNSSFCLPVRFCLDRVWVGQTDFTALYLQRKNSSTKAGLCHSGSTSAALLPSAAGTFPTAYRTLRTCMLYIDVNNTFCLRTQPLVLNVLLHFRRLGHSWPCLTTSGLPFRFCCYLPPYLLAWAAGTAGVNMAWTFWVGFVWVDAEKLPYLCMDNISCRQ